MQAGARDVRVEGRHSQVRRRARRGRRVGDRRRRPSPTTTTGTTTFRTASTRRRERKIRRPLYTELPRSFESDPASLTPRFSAKCCDARPSPTLRPVKHLARVLLVVQLDPACAVIGTNVIEPACSEHPRRLRAPSSSQGICAGVTQWKTVREHAQRGGGARRAVPALALVHPRRHHAVALGSSVLADGGSQKTYAERPGSDGPSPARRARRRRGCRRGHPRACSSPSSARGSASGRIKQLAEAAPARAACGGRVRPRRGGGEEAAPPLGCLQKKHCAPTPLSGQRARRRLGLGG